MVSLLAFLRFQSCLLHFFAGMIFFTLNDTPAMLVPAGMGSFCGEEMNHHFLRPVSRKISANSPIIFVRLRCSKNGVLFFKKNQHCIILAHERSVPKVAHVVSRRPSLFRNDTLQV
jgi:hypothetical protein